MRFAYWIAAVFGSGFLAWAHCHTDEIPIVFAFVIAVGAVLGAIAPRRAVFSWIVAAAPVPLVETLVHYSLLRAPWPASHGFPFEPLIAAVPAGIGVAAGAGLSDNKRFR